MLYDDIDIVKRLKSQWLRLVGNAVRMTEGAPTLKVCEVVPAGGKRGRERLPHSWWNQIESDLASLAPNSEEKE